MGADADVIVVGHGLAGLTAAVEVADAGKKVVLVDQEPGQSLGGQAFWSLGGLFGAGVTSLLLGFALAHAALLGGAFILGSTAAGFLRRARQVAR